MDLTKGTTALSQDFNMIVWRMKMLGFNAIRLPFIFDSHWGLGLVCCLPLLLILFSAMLPENTVL